MSDNYRRRNSGRRTSGNSGSRRSATSHKPVNSGKPYVRKLDTTGTADAERAKRKAPSHSSASARTAAPKKESTSNTSAAAVRSNLKSKAVASKTRSKPAASANASTSSRSTFEQVLENVLVYIFNLPKWAKVTAASVVIGALLFGIGYAVFDNVWNSNELFIEDVEETGSEAIVSRLETLPENKDKVTYFLIAGVDKSSKLTDCIWVMCFDNEAKEMNVLQIPRDTYVGNDPTNASCKINCVYGNPKKVNWCEECGYSPSSSEIKSKKHKVCGTKITTKRESNINALIRCINTNLSLPIDHFVLFDFEGFKKVIDALGGVDITLESDLSLKPYKYTLKAGENHLNGDMALAFMRHRKSYAQGDLGRVKAQRQLVTALMDKVTAMDVGDMLNVLTACTGYFSTDLSLAQLKEYATSTMKFSSEDLHMFELPGGGTWVKPYPSFYECNKTKTVEALNEKMLPYSEKLTVADIKFPPIFYDNVPVVSDDETTTQQSETTTLPSVTETAAPTSAPTQTPTDAPTEAPTQPPTEPPTEAPTQPPTEAPTQAPTAAPTSPPAPEPEPEPSPPALEEQTGENAA